MITLEESRQAGNCQAGCHAAESPPPLPITAAQVVSRAYFRRSCAAAARLNLLAAAAYT